MELAQPVLSPKLWAGSEETGPGDARYAQMGGNKVIGQSVCAPRGVRFPHQAFNSSQEWLPPLEAAWKLQANFRD